MVTSYYLEQRELTDEESKEVYMRLSKESIVEMLIECNKMLIQLLKERSGVFLEREWPKTIIEWSEPVKTELISTNE